jgi:hypothetical protein
MSKKEKTISTKTLQQENKLLKENLSLALDTLYGWPNHPASLTIRKVYDKIAKTVTIYASFRYFTMGKHTWSYRISKGTVLSRPISKTFTANEVNMGFEDIKIDTVSVDGAYQYPFKIYEYELNSGGLQDSLILRVPDKNKEPING